MMKHTIRLVIATAIAGFMSVSQANAQNNDDNRTILTFSQPVAVPGRVLLAGTYTFELDHSQMNRHLVRIYDARGSRLISTAFSIPVYRAVATENTVITFREVAAGAPQQIRTWFYPGHTVGDELVYRKMKQQATADDMGAATTAQGGNDVEPATPVMTDTAVPAEMPKDVDQPRPVDQDTTADMTPETTPQTTPPATTEEPRKELPHTASALPIVAVLGVGLLAIGVSVRRYVMRHTSH